VIPPKANSAFVAAMEDVLAVYTRPHDPDRVLVCLDETSKQLIAETRVPIPMKPGRAARVDYEYERNGTANLFMLFAPLEGWRHVKVTDRHTKLRPSEPGKRRFARTEDHCHVCHRTSTKGCWRLNAWPRRYLDVFTVRANNPWSIRL
jgi:hypothetical protein